MKLSIFLKSVTAGFFFMAVALNSNAQKINEQDLKVKVMDITSPTAKLMSLKPVTFQYDLKKFSYLTLPAGNQFGFLAANVQPLFPEMVSETSKSYASGKNNANIAQYEEVQNEKLIPVLVAAIKEQQEEINLLKREIEHLKDKKAE